MIGQVGSDRHDCILLTPCRRRGEFLSLSDYASLLLFIWRFVWGLYERAHIITVLSSPRTHAQVVGREKLWSERDEERLKQERNTTSRDLSHRHTASIQCY